MNSRLLLCFITFVVIPESTFASQDLCTPPEVENGIVEGGLSEDGKMYLGNVMCNQGYELHGKQLIKCMNGIRSADYPVCTKIGGCKLHGFPEIRNGRVSPVRPYRGSVLRVKCNPGFKIFGQPIIHCTGDEWSHKPVCAISGCDESSFKNFPHGEVTHVLRGGYVTFSCNANFSLEGSPTLVCNGASWNASAPICISSPALPELDVVVDGELEKVSDGLVFARKAQKIQMSCHSTGHPEPILALHKDGRVVLTSRGSIRHAFLATPSDNQTVWSCSAANKVAEVHGSPIMLALRYSATKVTLVGPSRLRASDGETVIQCETDTLDSPVEINFQVLIDESKDDGLDEMIKDGFAYLGKTHRNYASENKGWKSHRDLTIISKRFARSKHAEISVKCSIIEKDLNEIASKEDLKVKIIGPPPKSIHVNGPNKMSFDTDREFTCKASPSQPPARLLWRVVVPGNSLNLGKGSDETEFPDGSSESKVVVSPESFPTSSFGRLNEFRIECLATHPELGDDDILFSHAVQVLYPPGTPEIYGIHDGISLVSGSEQKLTCSTKAGNPPAKLSWFRGLEMMSSHYNIKGDTVTSEVVFVIRPEDSGSEFKCEAINEAIPEPISKKVRIQVHQPRTTTPTTTSTTMNMITTTPTFEQSATEYDLLESEIKAEKKVKDMDSNYFYNDEYRDTKRGVQDYDYNDSDYEYPEARTIDVDPTLKHPELVHTDLFKNVPTVSNIDVDEMDVDMEAESSNTVEVVVPPENQNQKKATTKSETVFYPKDAPYTQTATANLVSQTLMIIICLVPVLEIFHL